MTDKHEPLDLDALSALCEAATVGPWEVIHLDVRPSDIEPEWQLYGPDCGATHGHDVEWSEADARFCAAVRTALPVLIARVREYERALTRIRDSECDGPELEASDSLLDWVERVAERALDGAPKETDDADSG